MSEKQLISSGSEYEQLACYSRAVVIGDDVLVAGTTGFDYQHMRIAEAAAEQAEQCFVNISLALPVAIWTMSSGCATLSPAETILRPVCR